MTVALIRRATPSDALMLADLAYRTFHETFIEGFALPYPAGDLEMFVAASYSVEATAARLADPEQACWIAEADGAPLAYAMVGPCHLPHAQASTAHGELYRLYVLRAAQGRRLGAQLLETSLAWMETRFEGPIWVGVWSGNVKAQTVYAARGFEIAGAYAFPVGTWRDQEFIMRRAARRSET